MTWADFQDAVQLAVVQASGLAGARVRWERASRDQPGTAGDLVILSVGDEDTDGVEYTHRPNPSPTEGAELLNETAEQLDRTVHLDWFAMGSGKASGALRACCRALRRESAQDQLEASGIALIEVGGVQSLPSLLETEFRDRARGSFVVRLAEGTTETITTIETATVTSSYDGVTLTGEV